MLLLRIEKKNLYISTRHEEKLSCFILITMAFHTFRRFNAKHMVQFTVLKELFIHAHKNKVKLFLLIDEK
jgi:hypothetical protein